MEVDAGQIGPRTIRNDRLQAAQRYFALPTIIVPAIGLATAVFEVAQGTAGSFEIVLLSVTYVITMAGITVGFHRYLTHRSFQASAGTRAALAVLGSMTAQGPVINWVSNHRRHHAHSDAVGDPHSPYVTDRGEPLGPARGLWHAHVGWLFDGEITNAMRFSKDLLRDPTIVRMNRLYLLWVLLGLAIPAAIGWLWTGTAFGTFQGFLWGGLVRVALNQNATWSIGSLAHIFGSRPFDTGEHEQSRNSFVLALPILGDGWHNNHHAFPRSAISGFHWWQVDPSAWIVRLLEAVGLAWDVEGVPDAWSRRRRARAQPPGLAGKDRSIV